MPTYTFQEIRRTKTVRFKCECGKRYQRKISETQTINPFNRLPNGAQKTFSDIWPELRQRLEGRTPNDQCPGCDKPGTVISSSIEGY